MTQDCSAARHVYDDATRATLNCLPNTGLDVWLLVALGVALVVLGVVMVALLRRMERGE